MKSSISLSNKLRTRRRSGILRPLVQIAVLAALIVVPTGIFHMLCPFGGIETLTRFLSQGLYVPKTGITNLILLGAVLVATFVAGPVFCGWLCPLGAVQDWVRAMAGKLGIKALKIPLKAEFPLSLIRYLVLGMIIRATTGSFNLVFLNADPYYALLHFWTGEVAPAALVVLGIVVVSSVFMARPWCRWFCPLGGILSLIGRISLIKMKRPATACVSCGRCAKACPVGIDPAKAPVVTDPRCIRCGDCRTACPPKVRTPGRTVGLSGLAAAALLAFFLIAPVFPGANPASGKQTGSSQPAVGLRAQSRLSELPSALDMSLDDIYTLLEIPQDYSEATRLIDIEDDFDGKTYAWIKERLEPRLKS